MPSTFLLQEMVVNRQWKQVDSIRELPPEAQADIKERKQCALEGLTLEVLAKIEKETPNRVHSYVKEQLSLIPNNHDMRYAIAKKLYDQTYDLPRTHNVLGVILSTL